ncbi:E3 ubiquitin-protein ligase RNF128 isoform X1 [Scyliorhinus canicula]|uniref:E3 ubiquitin-protein ligase RNF128 isoform X1 n=1 Tax=Scyliorhinus canicula TaxID=7830 RepID=UPI0018F2B322|nr:E3 ubiquitin-protein ligase RNF128 isoform X1 [Scyliorhinus canicula]
MVSLLRGCPGMVWLSAGQLLCGYCSLVTTFWTAYINVSFSDPGTNQTVWQRSESGIYGQDSPLEGVQGLVGIPQSPRPFGCNPELPYFRPQPQEPWVALIERGNGCTFSQKIQNAAGQGANAAVIFNYPTPANEVVQMSHPGTGDTVAVMIGNIKGSEILALVKDGISVSMVIEVGKQHGPWMSQYSIFFVSISFFVVTAATVGYFIFYSARRLRIARAQTRKQKQLKHEAKKAINQLDVRVLKHGDQETGPDADSCAVCIDAYKPNDVVRILTCNHIFHKNCIDPWLLEHRTCPMCKCDILKALGIEIDIEKAEETPEIEQSSSNPQRTGPDSQTEVPESAIYTLPTVFGPDRRLDESPVIEDHHYFSEEQRLFNNDGRVNSLSVYVLPQDNPGYEDIDLQDEEKS